MTKFDEAELRVHLSELQDFSSRHNRHGYPEIAFFKAGGFSAADFAAYDFYSLSAEELREVCKPAACGSSVMPCRRSIGRTILKSGLATRDVRRPDRQGEQAVSEEVLLGMSSEFYMQIEWLPGGRIVDGELIFDSVFDEPARPAVESGCATTRSKGSSSTSSANTAMCTSTSGGCRSRFRGVRPRRAGAMCTLRRSCSGVPRRKWSGSSGW